MGWVGKVSIHAPVWGATDMLDNILYGEEVSIHAPVWGATVAISHATKTNMFQSTHPCGVRLFMRSNSFGVSFVSIHAPVWGATAIKNG